MVTDGRRLQGVKFLIGTATAVALSIFSWNSPHLYQSAAIGYSQVTYKRCIAGNLDRLLLLLVEYEGCRTKVYNPVPNEPTIGVGHLLLPSELSRGAVLIGGEYITIPRKGLEPEHVRALLEQDTDNAMQCVFSYTNVALNYNQLAALTSFVFNVGCGAYRRSTLLRHLNAGYYNRVPSELIRWTKSRGRTLKGLVRRRQDEGRLFSLKPAR